MLHAIHAQHVIAKASRDDERQLARISLAAVRALTQPVELAVRQPDVNASRVAIEPNPRSAIHARFLCLLLPALVPQLIRRPQILNVTVAMQRHHRVRKISQRQRPLILDAPHRLPAARQKLRRRASCVCVWKNLRRDELIRRAADRRLPAHEGCLAKLTQPAIDHRHLTRIRCDGDRCLRCSRLHQRRLLVIHAAAQIQSVPRLQLPQRMTQRLPRRCLRSIMRVITPRRVHKELRPLRHLRLHRHRQRSHRRMGDN